ncbi:hypothetical protein N7509_012174 [Penicillium cosmopolitanum]|uniref:G-patch domain-containing protein n=1 Tax=Penicillium cosmopolitanum TaxID=1131564 RepID=A0A9W9SIJ3_9EURO|nr:uncharacterized protein N7509_012174 [Penicillium cosmopolitanum]KAJ5379055.1 hypothetical protein N7509_012174 [Penicillium cosmopolitanum]
MAARQDGDDGEDGEDYFLPLEDQSIFGAGIRRKRVQFVRSSEHELNTTTTRPSSTPSGPSIADAYLSINHLRAKHTPHLHLPTHPSLNHLPKPPDHCEICNLPLSTDPSKEISESDSIDRPHEASLAHQVCLTHSHPPSHLDRTRVGLKYLSTYGWDPDSRRGLGAPGREGIREPLKGRVKNDTAGLGVGLDADGDRIKDPPPPPPKKVQKLNAKQMRKNQMEERKRGEKLRNLFFMSDDVLKYLGEEV